MLPTMAGMRAEADEVRRARRVPPAPPRRRWLRRCLLVVLGLFVLSVLPVLLLRVVDPPTSAFMLARSIEARGDDDFVLRHAWVDFDAVSPQLPIALVAAEDQTFPTHDGFDVAAIRQVLDKREAGEATRGASTISQQTAKNLFLWSGRSWLRKGLEAYYTTLIELTWPKRRILEVYVNIVEFGDGVYGAEAAAQHFFGKPAAALDASDAALLAAVLPNPQRLHVDRPSAYVLRRQRWIARQVRQLDGPAWLRECCG